MFLRVVQITERVNVLIIELPHSFFYKMSQVIHVHGEDEKTRKQKEKLYIYMYIFTNMYQYIYKNVIQFITL